MKTNKNILKALAIAVFFTFGAAYASARIESDASPDVADVSDASAATVKVTDSGVEIHLAGEESMELTVYAITGQIVKSQSVEPGVTAIELSRGYYIVRIGREAKRVVIM